MANEFHEIENSALKLNVKDRAKLATRLLKSLEKRKGNNIEKAWIDVAIRRKQEIESGVVNSVPLEEAIEKARSLIFE
ncbi:MAG: addiction module protein [Balneolales bacterium]|nr:addiction module protein [Balneolales bacterium]